MSVTTASGRHVLNSYLAPRTDERGFHLIPGMLEQDIQPLGHRRLIIDCEFVSFVLRSHVV